MIKVKDRNYYFIEGLAHKVFVSSGKYYVELKSGETQEIEEYDFYTLDRLLGQKLDKKVDRLCMNCPNAKKCHEECEYCEKFERELENE